MRHYIIWIFIYYLKRHTRVLVFIMRHSQEHISFIFICLFRVVERKKELSDENKGRLKYIHYHLEKKFVYMHYQDIHIYVHV